MSGFFVTSTDTGVGKTVIAGALAWLVRRQGRQPGVFKPVATGCRYDPRLGLVSADAEFLAHCAEARETLEVINPVRYAGELAPMVAARREDRSIDWAAIDESFARIRAANDWIIVEGVGGLLVPIDERNNVADLARRFGLPLVIVVRPGLGTINHTLLTVEAARSRGLPIATLVVNGYEPASGTLAEETNPEVIAELTGLRIPLIVPHDADVDTRKGRLGESILFPLREFVSASLQGLWKPAVHPRRLR
ncbi:MAG: dethiobiotin synthase [Planctomycetes bacterium]|nr:dethiobiotin synthase [Planctomycetota bacterium]